MFLMSVQNGKGDLSTSAVVCSIADEKCSIVSAGCHPLFGCVFAVEKGPFVNDVTQISPKIAVLLAPLHLASKKWVQ